jgi:glycosyltransferase involved in cell wall biosynthesis
MKRKPRISVIVPVYNAEATIGMAIGALVSEQFGNVPEDAWEIVAVDDGSSDNSLSVLQQWQQRFPDNITVLTGPNGGVSDARNKAMEHACGEWIAFVDADDCLLAGALVAAAEIGDDRMADAVRFGFSMVKPDECVADGAFLVGKCPEITDVEVCYGLEFLDRTRGMINSRSQWNVCFGICRRCAITDIKFHKDIIIGEDCIFTWEFMLGNPKIALIDKNLYLYVQYPSSAMNNTSTTHVLRMMDGRHRFCYALLDLRREYADRLGARAIEGLDTVARNAHYEAVINGLVAGRSFSDIWRDTRLYKNHGMRVKPGKPRFYDRSVRYSTIVKIRRWVAAYIIPVAMGVADAIRGRGLWLTR